MRRRALLAGGTALLPTLAGCAGLGRSDLAAEAPTARLSMTPVSDADVARRVHYALESGEVDAGTDRATLMNRLTSDGEATTERVDPLLPDDRPVVYDGTVYRLAREVVEETPATVFSVKIDIVDGDERDGRTVAFPDLPAVDRRVLEREGFADGEPVGVGTTVLYTDAEVEASVLVPETDVSIIEWPEHGSEAEWVVDDGYDRTLKRFRYSVAESTPASEVGADLRERFAWTLSGLPDAERDLVERAIEATAAEDEHGYVVVPDETPSPAFTSLAERFSRHGQVRGPGEETPDTGLSGTYLVHYDRSLYWTVLLTPDRYEESPS